MDEKNRFLSCVGVIAVSIGLIVVAVLFNGIAARILWHWFVESYFGLPPITLPQMIGIGLVIDMLVTQYDSRPKDKKEQTERAIAVFLRPAIAVFVGWIVTLFM